MNCAVLVESAILNSSIASMNMKQRSNELATEIIISFSSREVGFRLSRRDFSNVSLSKGGMFFMLSSNRRSIPPKAAVRGCVFRTR